MTTTPSARVRPGKDLVRGPLALLLLVAAACGSGGHDGSSSSSTGPSDRTYDFSAFESEVESFLDETGLPGLGAVVVHREDGEVFRRGFGTHADDRVYLLASASKMVTAGVLLRLQDQGILDMNEPIVEAVGAWEGHNPAITPAQLVSNSSGLVGLGPDPTFGPYLCQYVWTGTLQDCARNIFTTDGDDALVVPPDTEFRYGGGQWQVAGGVAEIVSGKSWAELVDETYVEPCGLRDFGYNNHFVQLTSPDGNVFGYPGGFDGNPATLRPTDNPNLEGGAYSSIGDYGALLLMHLRGGVCGETRVLSEEAIRQLHADRIGEAWDGSTGNPLWPGYGMGWWVERSESPLIYDPGAYGAVAWIDAERGYAAFLAMEASSGVGVALSQRTVDLIAAAVDAAG